MLLKRDAGAISPLTLNALPMGLAGLLLCAAGLVFEHPDPATITGESLAALLYLGTVASVAGFLAYFQLLRHLGPVPLSLVFVLFPAVAQAVAVASGERALHGTSLALLGVVLGASLVALTSRARTSRQASAALPLCAASGRRWSCVAPANSMAKALTTSGSNSVPAQRSSSASASSGLRAAW